jgi:U32 family peptidase
MKKVELLAPAGSYEKLEYAAAYGADAVYLGGNDYSMRALADNFSAGEIRKAVGYLHARSCKAYVTLNIAAKNAQVDKMADMAEELYEAGADAFIVSDLGVLKSIKKRIKDARIHMSTQANITNYGTASMYYDLGAERVVLARELSLGEISEIRIRTPKELEIEVFVHGAMCISYSGRCLLSNYITYRDSNQGKCAQACRWQYSLMEEKRPGEYFPVFEDDSGTYIFNSKDLCLIEHIDKLIGAGVDSFKIEGRMKSIFYVASVVKVYREAIDRYYLDPKSFTADKEWTRELEKVSHREYTKGFINGRPNAEDSVVYSSSSYIRGYTFCGVVAGYDSERKMLIVEQRNNFKTGDVFEIVSPYMKTVIYRTDRIFDEENNAITEAPHAQMIIYLPYDAGPLPKYSLLRRNDL